MNAFLRFIIVMVQRVLHTLATTQEVPRHTRLHERSVKEVVFNLLYILASFVKDKVSISAYRVFYKKLI